MKTKLYFCTALLSLLFLSCSHKNRNVEFSPTATLDITPDVEWALVTVPLASFYAECNFSSEVTSYARNGDIFEVHGKKTVKFEQKEEEDEEDTKPVAVTSKKTEEKFHLWYLLEPGWIDETQVKIFDTKLKAQNNK